MQRERLSRKRRGTAAARPCAGLVSDELCRQISDEFVRWEDLHEGLGRAEVESADARDLHSRRVDRLNLHTAERAEHWRIPGLRPAWKAGRHHFRTRRRARL